MVTNSQSRALEAQRKVVSLMPHSTTAGLDMMTLGKTLAASGYFKDTRDEAQAIVKVLYGAELGIAPISSMMGVHIIEGKPAYSANIMAAAVKKSGRYTYRIRTHTTEKCELEFFEGGESVGLSAFTIEEARTAGLATKAVWKSYPRNMLFARAMSNGFRWYCPDLTGGAPAYTPEELGAEVDGDGSVIEVTARTIGPAPPARSQPAPHETPPELPHPAAVDTGETYQGAVVWRVGAVACLERRRSNGGVYLQSTVHCPVHDAPFFLSSDASPDAWAHGKGESKCHWSDVFETDEEEGEYSDAGAEDQSVGDEPDPEDAL